MEASVVLSRALVASSHNLDIIQKKKNKTKGHWISLLFAKTFTVRNLKLVLMHSAGISRDYMNSQKST